MAGLMHVMSALSMMVALFISVTCWSSAPVQAGSETASNSQAKPQFKQPWPTHPKLPYVRSKEEFKRDLLKQPPTLPSFTAGSPGATYIMGACYPGAKGGFGYTLMYASGQPVPSVLQWYHNMLTENRWSITSENKMIIRATKDGIATDIIVRPSYQQPYRAETQITYRMNMPWMEMQKGGKFDMSQYHF